MDSGEKLRVVDRPSQEELENLDVAEVQLVYNSSHFKSLATGGNVSQALALVGEKACYQSVCSYAGQIVLLGTKVGVCIRQCQSVCLSLCVCACISVCVHA
uniref:Uncharacterized protein n=1 Tax=Hucho hucho TaxID=62062 RepID=A0A4W5L133_9TELE